VTCHDEVLRTNLEETMAKKAAKGGAKKKDGQEGRQEALGARRKSGWPITATQVL